MNQSVPDNQLIFSCLIGYENKLPLSSALRPQIRLEISFSAPTLFAEEKPLRSFVATAAKTEPEVSSILCVTPVETAADKLSALTWRVLTRDRQSKNDDPTMIRHLHDLAALEEVATASDDFRSLTSAFLDMDFTNRSAAACLPESSGAERLKQALEMLRKDEQYAQEYEQFVRGMSYARQDDVPSYKEALAALERLIVRILVDPSSQTKSFRSGM